MKMIAKCARSWKQPDFLTWRVAAVVGLYLLLSGVRARAESAAERAAKAGELTVIKNFRVLRLSGADIRERGFAHGYLLAESMRDDMDAALRSLPGMSAKKYETSLLPWSNNNFEWDSDAKAELDGMFEGLVARLEREKDGLRLKFIGRDLRREDLNAMNAIGDYYGPACSGFAAWGKRTAGGEVIHSRTLDFPLGPKAIADQVIFVSEAMPGGSGRKALKAWVAVGWPGLIAQYSGMNSAGLVVCLHDGYNLKPGGRGDGIMARGLLLRRMLEQVDPEAGDPALAAAELSSAKPVACGNLFQLSWPAKAAEKLSSTPSAVLEFDPCDRKTQIVRMDGSSTLVLTNHFRLRAEPVACERFQSISGGLAMLEQAGKAIGLVEARKLLMSAEQPVAAHSIYFFPDRLEFQIALSQENVMSPRVVPTGFTLKELFKQ